MPKMQQIQQGIACQAQEGGGLRGGGCSHTDIVYICDPILQNLEQVARHVFE